MSYLSDDEISKVRNEYIIVGSDLRDLTTELVLFLPILKSNAAKKYCQFGLARRTSNLRKCVDRFYECFLNEIDEKEVSSEIRFEQTAYINYFFLCISGGLDNLAWIVASENNLSLSEREVSIHNPKIRECMPQELRAKLNEYADWLNYHIKNFRDPVAHRISPYVIPEMRFDDGTKTQLAYYIHDFDHSPLVPLHPQVICDVKAFMDIVNVAIESLPLVPEEDQPIAVKDELRTLVEKSIDDLSVDQAILHIGTLIDLSYDHFCEFSAKHAQKLIDVLGSRNLSVYEKMEIQYFLANSWNLLSLIRNNSTQEAFAWERSEVEREIVVLRNAVKDASFSNISVGRQAQIRTNLGNRLSEIGRPIAAIRMYDSVLDNVGPFGMAQGGKGICFDKYSMHLYDEGHAGILSSFALDLIKDAANADSTEEHARSYFKSYLEAVNYSSDSEKINYELADDELGESAKEIEYRKWCAREGLFLNPLNDLGNHPLAFRDVLGIPSLTIKINKDASPPKYFKYFNILKQEYVSARYLLFEGLNDDERHFSDRNVLIYDTLDYPAHSFAMERIKAAYRMAYSLLDKVAFFLRDYFEIAIPDEKVYFKTIWYNGSDKRKGLRKVFLESESWPLRGLFWLSKDLFEKSGDFRNSIEPDAEYLYDLRNNMEHRFFSLHQLKISSSDDLKDNLKLAEDELEAKTLAIFRLAREALIYLSLSIQREEHKRNKNGDGLSIEMDISIYEDEWKKRW